MAIIARSGRGQERDKQRALESGFDHHLTKPVEHAMLEKLLASLLKRNVSDSLRADLRRFVFIGFNVAASWT
jgi:DNA-binding response OmpR family regulator